MKENIVTQGSLIHTIAIVVIICLFTGCTKIDTRESIQKESLPELELFGSTVYVTRGQQSLFNIKAPHISRHESKQLMQFSGGIKVDFFDNDGNHSAVLTADEGDIYERTNRLEARGDVIVKSDSGMVLLADELYYTQDNDRVMSDGFVTVITDNDSLSGQGFSSASDLSDWVILNSSGTTWRKLE
ncbi:MAG: LPS export ABC transporter periplasmic protein LptC [Candidatus Hatepunaea meridiana]|nr:LPS export ABC transporter periplasmic protein LptC [Candidatus Hatepunaea meridiana]